ncbi:hypothetical protein XNA1_2640002 [Xenorhabdus nematophila str. Anatoliense]|nr:hypothetical protein XNA1_2640002 [Xenorhabdus nematophila str. Anatoliense]
MFKLTKHRLRQIGYRYLAFSEDPLYLVFEKMYQCDPRPLNNVIPHPAERGFLLTNFICPDFAPYRGKEVTFFNSRHAVVYWLPGAEHSGGGYVTPGIYSVIVGGYAVKQSVELCIVKNDENTVIQSAILQTRSVCSMEGGFISFKMIAKELQCLALQWLTQLHDQYDQLNNTYDNKQLREVISAVQELYHYDDLRAHAVSLQRLLDNF